MAGRKYIKCRFCSWKTLRFTTNRAGKCISGYPRLERHVEINHESNFYQVLDSIYPPIDDYYEEMGE